MMSSMCVDATVRSAAERGFTVTVVHDALRSAEPRVRRQRDPRRLGARRFMAALGDGYATLASSDEVAGA